MSNQARALTYIALMVVALIAVICVTWPYIECGVPMGEQCGTDTECECLHGVGD